VEFELTPTQLQRKPRATLNATFGGTQGSCIPFIMALQETTWPLPPGPEPYTYVNVLRNLGGGSPNGLAMVHDPNSMGWSTRVSGNHLSADLLFPSSPIVRAGFEAFMKDGLGDEPITPTSFPQDNASCMAQYDQVELDLAYPPMPPETPLGCTGTALCNGATVSCKWSPDVFTLVAHLAGQPDRVAATLDLTAAPAAVNLSDPAGTPATTYSVCSGSLCADVPMNNTCDFALATNTAIAIPAGVTSVPIEIEATGTYAGDIALSFGGAPSALFSAAPTASTVAAKLVDATISTTRATYFTVAAGYGVAPQSAMLTLTGTNGLKTHALQIPVTISACVPKTCASEHFTCGMLADGCGGPPVSCGSCGAGATCSNDHSACCANSAPAIVRRACMSGDTTPNPPIHCGGKNQPDCE
jgi:hypothetical protein